MRTRLLTVVPLYLFLIMGICGQVFADISVPTIEKLIKERIRYLTSSYVHGCVFDIRLGEENLFEKKKIITNVFIGNDTMGANVVFKKLYIDIEYFEGDISVGDCLTFELVDVNGFVDGPRNDSWGYAMAMNKFGNQGVDQRWLYVTGKVADGQFRIIKEAVPIVFKNELTVDDYYEMNLSYGKHRVVLNAQIDSIELNSDHFKIFLFSEKWESIEGLYPIDLWKNDEVIKGRLRSLKPGDLIRVEGSFWQEQSPFIFDIRGLLD